MSMEALKRLMAPAFFLVAFLLPALYVDDASLQVSSHLLQRAIGLGHYVIGISLWLTLAWLIIWVIEVMVWPLLIERRLGRTTPRLLQDFVRFLVIVVALGTIISELFEAFISEFLAASRVVGLVLGFALHSMIADFFLGIGTKRSVLTDGGGVPIGPAVEGANRHDFKMARTTIASKPVERPAPTPEQPQGLCLDKSYDFDEVRDLLAEFGFTAHLHARGEEAYAINQEAGYKARRWVVERTHSWMNRFRRVLMRWARKSSRAHVVVVHPA